MSRGTIGMTEVEDYIRRRVHSPDWRSSIQLELDVTEDAGRRRELEHQLRLRREAMVTYGEISPTPLPTERTDDG